MAYAYVGIVVPSRQPVRGWSQRTLASLAPEIAGFDEYELGGWFVRADLVDEQLSGIAASERLDAPPTVLRRDPLLRLYAAIDTNRVITHRAQLQRDHWLVRYSNRAWIEHLRSIITPACTFAFAIVHVSTLNTKEPDHVPTDLRQR